MFPVTIFIRWSTHDGSDWYWRQLCIVYDNEALGYLERLLSNNSIEFRVGGE